MQEDRNAVRRKVANLFAVVNQGAANTNKVTPKLVWRVPILLGAYITVWVLDSWGKDLYAQIAALLLGAGMLADVVRFGIRSARSETRDFRRNNGLWGIGLGSSIAELILHRQQAIKEEVRELQLNESERAVMNDFFELLLSHLSDRERVANAMIVGVSSLVAVLILWSDSVLDQWSLLALFLVMIGYFAILLVCSAKVSLIELGSKAQAIKNQIATVSTCERNEE